MFSCSVLQLNILTVVIVNCIWKRSCCYAVIGCVLARQASTFTSVDAVNGTGTGAAPDGKTDSGPLRLYEHRLSTGELRPDENQLVVVQHLQKLSDGLDGYKHQQQRSDGMLSEMSSVCTLFSLILKSWYLMCRHGLLIVYRILVLIGFFYLAIFRFCAVNNARFHRFAIGQISRNLNTTTSISEVVKTFRTEFWTFLQQRVVFLTKFQCLATSGYHNSAMITDHRKFTTK